MLDLVDSEQIVSLEEIEEDEEELFLFRSPRDVFVFLRPIVKKSKI